MNEKRQKKLEDILNGDIIRVYCDCSLSSDNQKVGLSCNIVGLGETAIYSKALSITHGWYSHKYEMEAILYSVETLYEFYKNFSDKIPEKCIILTDLNSYRKLKDQYPIRIQWAVQYFEENHSGVKLTVHVLGDEKKNNPFHKAAHNEARRMTK